MALESTQSILVVGGGLGIGLEATKHLLKTTPATTRISVFGLHASGELTDEIIPEYLGRIHLLVGDVTKPDDRKRAIDSCVQFGGGLDTMIYCAGIITPIVRIDDVALDEVRQAYEVNVFGAIAMCQLALPYIRTSFKSAGSNPAKGKILLLSSACDFDIKYRGWMPYCTSKAALSRFIQMLAHENPDVWVQGIYPGLTRTQMPADVIAGKYKGVMADEEIAKFQKWDHEQNMVEPAGWCGEALARLANGTEKGGESGEILYYDAHVPDLLERKKAKL